MDLLEYQGKELFAGHGLPVPAGRHARTPEEAVTAAGEIGCPVAVKAQVLIGGRGKSGGIKIAADEGQARAETDAALPMVNKLRQSRGLSSLSRSRPAEVAAIAQAKRMARAGEMSHLIGFNDSFGARMKGHGVPLPAAENIATAVPARR